MTTFQFDWQTGDRLSLKGQGWIPEDTPKAILCQVHGFGEHIGRYEHVAAYYTQKGIGMVGFDLRGHGQSGGLRGYVAQYDDLIADISQCLALLHEKFEGVPILLNGHSMGGNLVMNFIMRYQPEFLKGAIITSPWLRLVRPPGMIKRFLADLMNIIYPKYGESAGIDTTVLSSDPQVGEMYLQDPLVHSRMSARLLTEITRGADYVVKFAGKTRFAFPVLMMHGKADQLTSHLATEEVASQLNGQVTLELWEGMRHELHNEVQKDAVLDKVYAWISQEILNQKG
ncbi:lysophospholipase [Rapidithrix thailandica]|uniref:Lysophospholipase n=1 Tax=Rapidithrix thailandica TaxID=413964 RepID=A0AAW9S899_9BACT